MASLFSDLHFMTYSLDFSRHQQVEIAVTLYGSHDFSRHQQVEVAVTLHGSHDFSRRQQVEVAVTSGA